MTSLESLVVKAEEYERQLLPDHEVDEAKYGFCFTQVSSEVATGIESSTTYLGVFIDGDERPHVFTAWGMSQLLSHVGVRPQWFSPVSGMEQVEELTKRQSMFHKHRLRRLCPDPEDSLCVIRGIVSKYYGDIGNLAIARFLHKEFGSANILTRASGFTDRAFYVNVVADADPIGLGPSSEATPGVTVRNSEVGYCSLTVSPSLFWKGTPVVLESKKLLRRVHRGSTLDMNSAFEGAVTRASHVWSSIRTKAPVLVGMTYKDEAEAQKQIDVVIRAHKGMVGLAARAKTYYAAQHHSAHNALHVFEAISASVDRTNQDTEYRDAAIAGAVLWSLLF